ncbi:TonB family protein [Ekhidna sp.]|uniref:energy transducer TonB n=1 Tax=Ekhidna sp. TaxID=2608089 RepID=UPI003B50C877
MSTDKNHSEQFERYLKGQMTPEEAHAFERDVLDDPFAQEALEGYESQGFESLDDIQKLKKQIQSRPQRKFPMLRIAAAVAMLIVGSILVFYVVDSSNDQALMTEDIQSPIEDSIKINSIEADETTPSEQLAEVVKEDFSQDGLRVEGKDEEVLDTFIDNNDKEEVPFEDDEKLVLADANEVKRIAAQELMAETEPMTIDSNELNEINTLALKSQVTEQAQGESDAEESFAPKLQKSTIQGEQVALARSKSSTELISGIITDDSGDPLPGVNVVIKGTTTGVVTDLDGQYELPKLEDMTLVYSFVGFESKEIEVGTRNKLDVVLGGATALQEVVVTGYGQSSNDDTYIPAKPENGSKALKKYLEENLIYPDAARENQIEGNVILELLIGVSGAIESISIKKSLGFGCDQEAIRLINEGPTWNAAQKGGNAVEDKVRVRVKFKLD